MSDATSNSTPKLRQIAGYEMLGILGVGGMGVVYHARHAALNRLVAIKMVRSAEDADPRALERFRFEAEIVAGLQHPNIVQIFQIGEQDGLPYLALEYVDGGSLSEKIAERPQPPDEAAAMVETLARAVQAAHERGVVHRDLKPANVLLAADGTPKIADFGLARRLERSGHSVSEQIAGTASYMAPEQAWGGGRAQPIGPATDVYALGAILYELLTGRPPFKAESSQRTLEMVWSKDPEPPHNLQPSVPRDLETICLRCLNKEAHRRYPSAAALADDIGRYRRGEPIAARAASRAERTWLWCRRNRVVASLLAALAASLVIGLAGTTIMAIQASNNAHDFFGQKVIAQNAATEADKKRLEADQAKKDALNKQHEVETLNGQLRERFHDFYDLMVVSAERALANGNFDEAARLLDGCPAELRNFEWRLRERLLQGSVLTRPVANGNLQAMAVSPDGKWVATGGNWAMNPPSREPVRIWDTTTWEMTAEFGDGAYYLAFSPDSQKLAVGWSEATTLWDIGEKKILVTFPESHGGLAFSPDGKWVAIGLDKTVWIYDAGPPPPVKYSIGPDGRKVESTFSLLAINKPVKTLTGSVAFVKSLAFSPDGKRLVAMSGVSNLSFGDRAQPRPSDIKVWDLETAHVIWELNNIEDSSWDLMAVNPACDRCVVAVREDNRVQLSNLTEKHEPISIVLPRGVTTLAFSPTGEDLYAGDLLGNIHVVDVASQDVTTTLYGHTHAVRGIGFLGDDRLLTASGDDTLKVWERDRQAGTAFPLPGRAPFAFSGDGRQIAAAMPTGEIHRWDLRTKQELSGVPAIPVEKPVPEKDEAQTSPAPAAPNEENAPPDHLGIVALAATTDPNRWLAIYSDSSLLAWDMAERRSAILLQFPPLETNEKPPPAAAPQSPVKQLTGGVRSAVSRYRFSPDRKFVARMSTWYDSTPLPAGPLMPEYHRKWGAVEIWDVAARKGVAQWRHELFLNEIDVTFSPESRHAYLLVSDFPALKSQPKTIAWELATGLEVAPEKHPRNPFRGAFSPDGSRIARIEGTTLKIIDAQTDRELIALSAPKSITTAEFSPDGERLIIAGEFGIEIYDAAPTPAFAPPPVRLRSK